MLNLDQGKIGKGPGMSLWGETGFPILDFFLGSNKWSLNPRTRIEWARERFAYTANHLRISRLRASLARIMKCNEIRIFLSQLYDRAEPITPVPPVDLDYLSANGYVLMVTKDDYEKRANDVARLSQIITQIDTEKTRKAQAQAALQQDLRKEHSFLFHLEGKEKEDELRERIQEETAAVSSEESALISMEAKVNELIQEKSMVDRMVAYDGGYLSLTGLGTLCSTISASGAIG